MAEYIRKNHFLRYHIGTTMYQFDKLAIMTAILYAARLQRRVPESDAEKVRTIADALADARLILAAVIADERKSPEDIREAARKALADWQAEADRVKQATPEQPPPSPGTIGRKAVAKATRRRGQSGVRPATEA